jgi:putative ABC transport system ATP-binding protein
MTTEAFLKTESLCRFFRSGTPHEIKVIRDLTVEFQTSELSVVKGPSGSGKTTLLSMLGTILRSTSGRILLDGEDLSRYSDLALSRLRRNRIGIIFQSFNLIPHLSAWENVVYPLLPVRPPSSLRDKAFRLLRQIGLEERELHTPEELSGGEQQRVAIARALVNDPEIILASSGS